MNLVQNPFAPSAFDNVVRPGSNFVDQSYSYVYNVVLTASQLLLGQVVTIDQDSDFLLRGIQIARATSVLGRLQLADNQGQLFSNDYVSFGAFLPGGLGTPFAVVPPRMFAAGGRILINIQDQSAAENTVQIVFRGTKRIRV